MPFADQIRWALLCACVAAGGLALSVDARAGQWQDGAHVYQKVCGHCHEAGVGPKIKERALPTAYIEKIVRNGNRAMPAFRASEIDDGALADVARLVSGSSAVTQK